MTVEDAKTIRKIGLKTLEDKRTLKRFAVEHGYSDSEIMKIVHAKTAEDILDILRDEPWHSGAPTESDLKGIDKRNEFCFVLCFNHPSGTVLSETLYRANMKKACFEEDEENLGEFDEMLPVPFGKAVWKRIRL